MNNSKDKKADWWFPPDMAALLGVYFVVLPVMFAVGWLGTSIFNAKSVGDVSALWTAIGLGAIGTVLLFFARLPLYRERRFLVFGPQQLDSRHRRFYWWAYRFIGASILLLILLLVIVR